ncbi:TPA: hypothetical protein U1C15_000117 [Streptococcus suis]|nr:hypothetical protein [Streptococcus suis]
MVSKDDFLALGVSERSLVRKLTALGLSLDNLPSDQEAVLGLYEELRAGSSLILSEGEALDASLFFDQDVRVGDALARDLSRNYDLIMLDTCCLLKGKSPLFLLELEKALLKFKKQVTVVKYVYDELERVRNCKKKEGKFKEVRIARESIDILERMFQKNLLIQSEDRERRGYGLADQEIFEIYNYEINKSGKRARSVLIFTNDKGLQFDLYCRSLRASVVPSKYSEEGKRVVNTDIHCLVARVRPEDGKVQRVFYSNHQKLRVYDDKFKNYYVNLYSTQAQARCVEKYRKEEGKHSIWEITLRDKDGEVSQGKKKS